MEKQNLKKLVTELLNKYEKLRDCDNKLTANVWNTQLLKLGYNIKTLSANDILRLFADNKLYSPSSIVRERRKLQECNLHLRGQKYKIRQVKLQEEMKARMKKNKLYKVVKYDENLNPKTQNFLNL